MRFVESLSGNWYIKIRDQPHAQHNNSNIQQVKEGYQFLKFMN